MQNIIGGMFGLKISDELSAELPEFLHGEYLLMVNARSAIHEIIDYLSIENIWLPSYLCEVIYKAVSPFNINYYPVDYNLEYTNSDWLDDVKENDAVLVIDYFGYPVDENILRDVKQKKAIILRDASQALFSRTEDQLSDYIIFNPRKFVGIPDGGVLLKNNSSMPLPDNIIELTDSDWWFRSLRTLIMRCEFDKFGVSREWFHMFQQNEKEAPIGPYLMSELSRKLLSLNYNWKEIARKRRENYQFLSNELNNIALYPNLTQDVVPIGFPVRLENRDNIMNILFENNIYPQIHWQLKGFVPESFKDSHELSGKIMTLVCDQRYNLDDMGRVVDTIKGYI